MAKKSVGNMEVEELMSVMKSTMNNLLEEKIANLPSKTDIEEIKSGIALNSKEINELRQENIKLKEEIATLKHVQEEDKSTIRWLEHQIKNNKLVFKGVMVEANPMNSVMKICVEKLKVQPQIKSARILAKSNYYHTIIAEFDSEETVLQILRSTKNLAGTKLSVDRDLNPRRQRNKTAMLMIRRRILLETTKHAIVVRDDKLKIKDKIFSWNNNNELVRGKENAEVILKNLYGDDLKTTNFNNIFQEIKSKN